jgi:hypothetical protein
MMNKDKDQDWLDALAGKSNPNADPEVTRRADLLRQTIQRHDASFGISKRDSEARFQKLRIRMRREGLLGDNGSSIVKVRFAIFVKGVTSVLSSVKLMMSTIIMPNEFATRGREGQQIVLAADPEDRLKQLAAELDSLGIKYQIERKGDKILLKAQGVDPVKDDVANFLERNHIKLPVGVDIELEIRPFGKQLK